MGVSESTMQLKNNSFLLTVYSCCYTTESLKLKLKIKIYAYVTMSWLTSSASKRCTVTNREALSWNIYNSTRNKETVQFCKKNVWIDIFIIPKTVNTRSKIRWNQFQFRGKQGQRIVDGVPPKKNRFVQTRIYSFW